MTELEYDILDELYFITSFNELVDRVDLDQESLKRILKSMFIKGWIRCYSSPFEEIFPGDVDLENEYVKYLYTASKAGLRAHNLDD
jgi:hypothetical protein